MVLSFAYWSLRWLLELVALRRRSEREKEIEILLLGHQLRVLERQVARPQLTQADPGVAGGVQPHAAAAGVAAIALRQPDDASALAPRAGRAPLDVSAPASRTPADRGRGA